MRVLLNGICNNREGNLYGNFYHMVHLATALGERDDIDFKVLCDEFGEQHYIKAVGAERVVFRRCGRINMFSRDLEILRTCALMRPDVYHRPTGQLPLLPTYGAEVMTVADINWRDLGSSFSKKIYKDLSYGLSLRRAHCITCVSQYTERRLLHYFPGVRGRTRVVYHGRSLLIGNEPHLTAKLGPYFISFGHHSHKNAEVCIRALKRLCTVALKLVIIGSNRYVDGILRPMVNDLGLNEKVVFVGRVSDAGLNTLYRHAMALLFMSKYEGFGLPVLEAMAVGCPVVGSNVASLPEVIGIGGVQIDPEDDFQLSELMNRISSDSDFRCSLAEAGRAWSSRFSWQRAATETIDAYESALSLRARRKIALLK